MSDLATLARQAIHHAQQAPQVEQPLQVNPVVRKLFVLLHGAYGHLFVAKFSTGEKDGQGRDKGIRAAMKVWESALAKYPADVIETAAGRLTAEHPEFPPNLPQFEKLCEAAMPRKTHAELQGWTALPPPALPKPIVVDFERVGDGKDNYRSIWARHQAGDKTISNFALRTAMQVLGIKKGATQCAN